MQDRISRYPGRVRLTPVAGQENVYDMILADEPTQEGTKINKATLLTDVVAASFGLPNTAAPNDVLSKIKTLMDASNGVINQKIGMITGNYTGDGTSSRKITLGVYPLAVILLQFGTVLSSSSNNVRGGLSLRNYPAGTPNAGNGILIDNSGFYVYNSSTLMTNLSEQPYNYIAFY